MSKIKTLILLTFCLVLCATYANAEMEADLRNTIKLDNPPVDLEVSLSGQSFYVLDNKGQLIAFDISGNETGRVKVNPGVNKIKISPRDDMLFLSNNKDKTIQVLSLAFTHDIDIKGSPIQGPKDAPVSLVVFSDFQCPYCARIGSIVDQVREKYPNDVKSVYMFFPLKMHQYATKAAQAAVAADKQGKFWEMHDLLFKNFSQLTDAKIDEFVETLKLDKAKFEKDKNSPETTAKIEADKKEGIKAGVRGTPSVYINGRLVRPANLEGMNKAVEDALKDAKKKK